MSKEDGFTKKKKNYFVRMMHFRTKKKGEKTNFKNQKSGPRDDPSTLDTHLGQVRRSPKGGQMEKGIPAYRPNPSKTPP